MNVYDKKLAIALMVGTTLGGSGAAVADNAVVATDAAPSDQLQEIVITAERRQENLQDTPIAVSAFSASQLEQQNVQSIHDLVGIAPNLQINRQSGSDYNNTIISIRGFNVGRQVLGVQPPVGVYVDDYYYPSFSSPALRILDLQSLEVLRGPQGTLFGRNSLGGAVRYNTVQPDTNDVSGHIEFTGGSFNQHDFSGTVNIPVSDMLAVKLTGAILRTDGYVHNEDTNRPVGDNETRLGRVQVRFTPTAGLTDDLTLEYYDSKYDGTPNVLLENLLQPTNPPAPGSPFPLPALNPNFYNLDPANIASNNLDDGRYVSKCHYCSTPTTTPDFSNAKNRDIRNTIAWVVNDWLTLKSLTGAFFIDSGSYLDTDYTPLNYQASAVVTREQALSQEFQASGVALDHKLNWIGGIYLYRYFEDNRNTSFNNAGPFAMFGPRLDDTSFENKAVAVYGQVSYEFVPQWTGVLGVRGTYEKDSAVDDALVPPDARFKKLTPEAKLQYQVTPEIMTYVGASEGFRGGLINTAGTPNVPAALQTSKVNPDTAWNYELGARTEWLDRHLLINATLYDEEYKNLQLLVTYPPGEGVPVPGSVIENAGKARFYGVEIESQANIDEWTFRANVATLNTRYLDVGNLSALANITTNSRFERAPKYSYSVGVAYAETLPVGALNYNLDWVYVTNQIQGNQDAVAGNIPAYGLLNGRVQYTLDKHWNFSFGIDNILNKYYDLNLYNGLYYVGNVFANPGPPRDFYGKIQFKF